jgi:hypothetical protein
MGTKAKPVKKQKKAAAKKLGKKTLAAQQPLVYRGV